MWLWQRDLFVSSRGRVPSSLRCCWCSTATSGAGDGPLERRNGHVISFRYPNTSGSSLTRRTCDVVYYAYHVANFNGSPWAEHSGRRQRHLVLVDGEQRRNRHDEQLGRIQRNKMTHRWNTAARLRKKSQFISFKVSDWKEPRSLFSRPLDFFNSSSLYCFL